MIDVVVGDQLVVHGQVAAAEHIGGESPGGVRDAGAKLPLQVVGPARPGFGVARATLMNSATGGSAPG